MDIENLEELFKYIVSESVRLKNKYLENEVSIEFADVFSKDDKEYTRLTQEIKSIGKIVYTTPTGDIYELTKPIDTVAGKLRYGKIRKPDNKLQLRGDADFNSDYKKLKERYLEKPHFELIVREKFEMLRLSDPDFGVMSCFSNIPVRKWI
ncbi:MAG TPA: hypothetical protein VIK81_00410 [Patescibacteria group bacterium]